MLLPTEHINLLTAAGKNISSNIMKEGHFYLMTYSTHFIYGYMASDIWQRTIQIVRGENLQQPLHGLFFLISSKGSFIMHHLTDRIAHTMAFVTSIVEHCLEREIGKWIHHEGSI